MSTKTFPSLYHKSKNGKIIKWNLFVKGSKIVTVWGQLNGVEQTSELICTPKNEGRSNQTTAEEQAIKEAEAMWKYQLDRKYRESIEDAQEIQLLPMLARSKSVSKDEKIKFPAHCQNKFDGLRCLSYWNHDNTEVILQSRNGKFYNVPHISEELKKILPYDTILDGELYVHGFTFQAITSWVKKLQPDTSKICYRVYDIPQYKGIDGKQWIDRWEDLKSVIKKDSDKIILCETVVVNNMDGVFEFQSKAVAEGYEGGILRIFDGLYLFGQRSRHELLKIKSFLEEDFEIVGYTSGKKGTKEENAIMFICKIKDGVECTVRPRGKISDREDMLKNAKSFLGKIYSVKFFEYTDEGNLRFPWCKRGQII